MQKGKIFVIIVIMNKFKQFRERKLKNEEYIEYIFRNEENAVELIKYKNIAEALEGATDSAKRVSDSVRKIILRYTE